MRAAALAALLALAACGGGDDDGGSIEPEPFPFTACGSEVDDLVDGTIDARWAYEYDAFGYPTVDRGDDGDDGSIDSEWTYEYLDGDLLAYQSDDGLDGDLDYAYEATYDGHLLQTEETDADGDELVETALSYAYDGTHITTRESDIADQGMMVDGQIDTLATYFYDADLIEHIEYDNDLDGTRDDVAYNEYDGAGNLVTQRTDYADDGTDDLLVTIEYDADGHRTRYSIDFVGSPGVEYEQVSTWSGDDVQSTEFITSNGTSLSTYLYDCP